MQNAANLLEAALPTGVGLKRVQTGTGLHMSYLEAGEGPVLLLLHGFPELAFSWRHVMPRLGKALSGNAEAYEYLPESAREFPYGEAFLRELRAAGFAECLAKPQTFGVASLYRGLA